MSAYTIDSLNDARAALKDLLQAASDYDGNNPGKYDARLRDARGKIRQIEMMLKLDGTLPLTEQEVLERELDRSFPEAQSKDIVVHNGSRYQRRFFPLERSRSRKSVTEWGKAWVRVDE